MNDGMTEHDKIRNQLTVYVYRLIAEVRDIQDRLTAVLVLIKRIAEAVGAREEARLCREVLDALMEFSPHLVRRPGFPERGFTTGAVPFSTSSSPGGDCPEPVPPRKAAFSGGLPIAWGALHFNRR
jgi:hypothetical protein